MILRRNYKTEQDVVDLSFLSSVDVESLKNLNLLLGCSFFAFTGAFLQEIITIYKGHQRSIKIHKIIIGTIIGLILFMLILGRYVEHINISFGIFANVICGLFGYELFSRSSSLDRLKNTTKDIHDIITNLTGIDDLIDRIFGNKNSTDKK